jgi:pyrroloquinoline quinone biosynthesis protein D
MSRVRHTERAARTHPARLHLAPAVRLAAGETLVLAARGDKVQLNEAAVAILRLCDGSRTRDEIVAAVRGLSGGHTQASDVTEFLEVARSRGWLVEA